jgi:methyl-accepting chemotaxis protein
MTIIMIVMISIGCEAILVGLVVLAVQAVRLLKTVRRAGTDSLSQVQTIVGRVERLEPRLRESAEKQKEVAERLEHLSSTSADLAYLADSLDEATGHMSQLKS